MAKQVINVGTLPNDGTGDTLLSAMNKINANFTDLYNTSYSSNVVNSFNSRQGTVSLLFSDVTGALGYTPVSSGGGTFTGIVVMNNGFVSNQSGVFDSNLTGVGSLPTAPIGTMIRAINLDTNQTVINLDSFINAGGTMSAAVFRGSRGTGAAPAAVQATDIMGQISAIGFGTTQFTTTPTGQINFISEGAFTNISNPTAISFQVTPSASVTPVEQMRLTSAGNLILSGTGAIQIPVGTTGQQPTPAQGMVRFNTNTTRFEFYNGSTWINHVRVNGDTMTGTLTLPTLVGTNTSATLDSFIIGGTTPLAGTFTTLAATNFSATNINSTPIGQTTPAAGSFTTLSATGTVTGVVGRLLNVQVFSTPGTATYTPTAGTNKVVVEVQAPGGGSGGCSATTTNNAVSQPGAGGTYAKALITTAFSGVTVTIGTAGTAGASGAPATNGGTGGTTSFGTIISCPGGTGGAFSAAAVTGLIAPTAAPAAATISGAAATMANVPGQAGVVGYSITAGTIAYSGAGGNSTLGFGGISRATNVAATTVGAVGTGFGAGASGSVLTGTQSTIAGAAGSGGVVVVYEYS